jgi:hypothetical protein
MICLANSQGIDLQAALERALEKYRLRDAGRYAAGGGSGVQADEAGAQVEKSRRTARNA